MEIKENDFVNIDYVGKTGGKIFDLTDEELAKKENIHNEKTQYGPVTIVVGAGHLIKGIDKALVGKKVGENFKIDVEPEDAFGKKNPKLLKIIPEKIFKKQEVRPQPGMTINVDNAVGYIVSTSAGRVVVDFNHPLAGKELNYEITVNKKIEGKEEKIESLLSLFTGKEDFNVNIENKEAKIKYDGKKQINPKMKELIVKEIKKYIDIEKVEFTEEFEDEKKSENENSKKSENENSKKSENENSKKSENESEKNENNEKESNE